MANRIPDPLHPVLKAWMKPGRILDYLRSLPEPREPILQAMLDLQDCLYGRLAPDQALKSAASVPAVFDDPDVALMFLLFWGQVSHKVGRYDELSALLNRAKAFVAPSTPVELRAMILSNEGLLVSARGNKIRRVELLQEALALVPRDSPRHSARILDLALFMAQLGRACELEPELSRVESSPDAFRHRVALIRFVQAAESGRFAEAERLLPVIESDASLVSWASPLFSIFKTWVELVRDRWSAAVGLAPPRIDGPPPGPTPPELPDWAAVFDHLMYGRVSEALAAARRQAGANLEDLPIHTGFESFNLIRAELASGHADAARHLIERRRERGNLHYLDDLFLARAELLAGRVDSAARHMSLLVPSIEKFDAQGRLDFELRLACEIPPGALFRLGRATRNAPERQDQVLPRRPESERGVDRMIGSSRALTGIREAILQYAPVDTPVLVVGETGTGKEMIARALHEEGPRKGRAFVAVNCGAVAESLLESELFGHERGAFTGASRAHRGFFEEAGEGTIFLDEIGEMPPRLQVALLRVLDTREIQPVGSSRTRKIACRIVAATNADLDERVRAGAFRKDLLFRLRRLEIRVPPLRERPEDVLELATHFLNLGRPGGRPAVMTAELKEAFRAHAWPGNVRELRNEIERMRVVNSDRLSYGLHHLRPTVAPEATAPGPGPGPDPVQDLLSRGTSPLRRMERLREMFRRYRKLTRAEIARILEVSLETASKDLKQLREEGLIERVEPTASPRTHYYILRGGA